MALTPWDIYACQQVWKWEHRKTIFFSMDIRNIVSYIYPQHSFLHNLVERVGEVAEGVGEHLLEGGIASLI